MPGTRSVYRVQPWPVEGANLPPMRGLTTPLLPESTTSCLELVAHAPTERTPLRAGTRNQRDLRIDVPIHAVDALTDLGDRSHRHQRDEPRKERVLDQVLALFFAD